MRLDLFKQIDISRRVYAESGVSREQTRFFRFIGSKLTRLVAFRHVKRQGDSKS